MHRGKEPEMSSFNDGKIISGVPVLRSYWLSGSLAGLNITDFFYLEPNIARHDLHSAMC